MHAILPVRVCVGNKIVHSYAFYDTGSSASFITRNLMHQLDATGPEVGLKLTTMHGCSHITSHMVRDICIKDIDGNNPLVIEKAYSRDEIPISTRNIPRPDVLMKIPTLKEFSGLVHPLMEGVDVGLLIGLDCPKALEPLEVLPTEYGTFACRLRHGWTINGPNLKGSVSNSSSFRIIFSNQRTSSAYSRDHGE